jgi:DNA-directed RNA polymerase specialized sigma24 family protein
LPGKQRSVNGSGGHYAMNESSGASESGSDAELLNTIRSGEPGSADLLRERHTAAARSLAGHLEQEPGAADDLVERAFALVLDAIQRGGGPSDAFRPYLLTAVRRAARDGGGSTQLPTDEQQIPDPGQPLIDPAPGLAASPVVTAFLSLPERWQAVLWHTEIEGATPTQAAPLLGLPAAEVVDLADRARNGLRRAYSQLQQAGCGHEDVDLADVRSALRATVAPGILGATATAYLADLAGSGAVSSDGTASGSTASGSSASNSASGSAGVGSPAPAGAGSWARTAGSSLTGRIRGSSAQQRTFAVGTVALLAMFALGGYALAQSPATSATTSGQRTAVVPAHSPPAPSPTAPTSGGPAGGVGSTARTPATGKSAGSPTPTAPAGGTAPAAPTVPSPPIPSRPTASQPAPTQPAPSPTAPSHAPSQPAPSQPTPDQPTPTPSMPSRPAPVGSGPAAPQVTAQISVADPAGLSNLAEITFGIADTGSVATGPLSASIAMPPDSTVLPSWSGPGIIIGWHCSAAGSSATCVHEPIGATVRTSGILTVAVTGSAACGQSVRVTVTGGAAVTSAQSAGTIQCAPSPRSSAADVHATDAPTPDPDATPSVTPDASPSESADPWWQGGWHRTNSPWPGNHWPGNHWPRNPWPGSSWPASPWPHPQWPAHRWPGR